METRSSTEKPTGTAHCKGTGASSQHGQVRCGRSGRQAATTIGLLDPLAAKTTAGWFSQDANCGKRLRATCQSQGSEVFPLLRLPKDIQWRSETVTMHSISRQFLAIQNLCMSSKRLKQRWTLPKFGSARRPFKVSRFRPRLGAFSARRMSTTWVLTSWYHTLQRLWRSVQSGILIRSSTDGSRGRHLTRRASHA